MNYHGVDTRQYTLAQIAKLLGITWDSASKMLKRGVLDPPMIEIHGMTVKTQKYWLYHQVQPVYIWYMHMRNKSIGATGRIPSQEERKVLVSMKKNMDTIFRRRAGLPKNDPYFALAGKYGVVWQSDEEVAAI